MEKGPKFDLKRASMSLHPTAGGANLFMKTYVNRGLLEAALDLAAEKNKK
jgi:hypothetical protein